MLLYDDHRRIYHFPDSRMNLVIRIYSLFP
jgi:hypothetical protein